MKVAIIGGHLSPALAVIDELPKSVDIVFFGRKNALEGDTAVSLEYHEIKARNIPHFAISTGRLQRRLTRHTLSSLFRFPSGLKQAYFLLHKEDPDVILSFGSYVSLPFVFAGSILRIPIVIHEQTLEAGLANKVAAGFARKICISWETSKNFFPKDKAVLTGNPVRKWKIENGKWKLPKHGLPFVYITGGSSGSHAINLLVEGCLEKLLDVAVVLHQSGDAKEFRDFERMEKLREALPHEKKQRYMLRKFVMPEDVGQIMQQADLVVGRSGINTVSELLYFGKPALLIPLPFSQRQEQLKNAQFLGNMGLAKTVEQGSVTPDTFCEEITRMLRERKKYHSQAGDNLKQLLRHAAVNIVEVVLDVSQATRHHQKKA